MAAETAMATKFISLRTGVADHHERGQSNSDVTLWTALAMLRLSVESVETRGYSARSLHSASLEILDLDSLLPKPRADRFGVGPPHPLSPDYSGCDGSSRPIAAAAD